MPNIRNPALDFRGGSAANPKYRTTRIVPVDGGAAFTLSSSSTTTKEFEIVPKVHSLSRSRVVMDISVAAGTNHVVLWSHGIPWCDAVEHGTRGGTRTTRLNSANHYYAITAPYTTKLEDMVRAGPPVLQAVDASLNTVFSAMVAPNSAAASATAIAKDYNGVRIGEGGTHEAASVDYREPQWVAVGGSGEVALLHIDMPLSQFHSTFLADPKDFYADEMTVLRFQFVPTSKLGYLDTALTGGTAAALGTVTVSNLSLYVALEVDEGIAKDIITKTRSGLTRVISFVEVIRDTNTGSTYDRQQKLNRTNGKNLLRILHWNGDTTESNRTCHDYDNQSTPSTGIGSLVSYFKTSMDGLALTEYDIRSGSKMEDYREMEPLLKDSCVINESMYAHKRLWCDDFSGFPLAHTEYNDIESGLQLDGVERTWRLAQTNASSLSHTNYIAIVTQKLLDQRGGQITVA